MSTYEKVKAIVVDQLQQDADNVNPDSTFVDDLGADSLDIVELKKAEKIKTVNDVVKYIDGNVSEE